MSLCGGRRGGTDVTRAKNYISGTFHPLDLQLYCIAWCLCQYRYAAETFIFSLLPLQPFTSCSVVQSSFKRQIFVLVNKYSKWICIFCQLHIQIRFHHWFCWPSRGKKILDGFSFRTTGDIFKIFLNQNFLKLKPRHQFLDNSNNDNDIKKHWMKPTLKLKPTNYQN